MPDSGLTTMPDRHVTSPAAFRAFYDRNVHRVVALGISLTGDRAAAEDIAQEAFVRAYRDWERIGGYEDPGAWVRRVAGNLAVSRWRRLRREANALRRLGEPPDAPPPSEPTDDAFWAAVRSLPRRQALAIALHYVDDLSVDEIAQTLDTTYSAAKSLLQRGRDRLATILQEDYR